MSTPPPSTPPSGSPRKRRRNDRVEGTGLGEADFADEGDLAYRGFSIAAPHSSISRSSATTKTSSAKKSNRRSASPVKTITLQMLRKPVKFVDLDDTPDDQLPMDARQLYQDIFDLAIDREGFIPKKFQSAVWDRIKGVKPRYFSHDEEELDSVSPPDELNNLLEIETDAKLCQSSGASEAAWNIDVHGPLLKLALKPFGQSLRRHILTMSRINAAFYPPMQQGSCYDVAGSKLVDFGIALHPEEDGPLNNAVRRSLVDLPVHLYHVNQASYDPIRLAPNVVSIETKAGSTGLPEARLQIGVWIAAWHHRMRILLQRKSKHEGAGGVADTEKNNMPNPLITLPVIIVVEHDWKLFFACDRGDHIVSLI
ncbi:hypothetical protein FDECE_17538 [Fusarium decemcellulare]|nr:hypothetical protein FDECE_17538 [Fusarium decemcellulare]